MLLQAMDTAQELVLVLVQQQVGMPILLVIASLCHGIMRGPKAA